MEHEWSIGFGNAVDAASGLLILLLGLFVVTRRPFRRVNLAFALFAAGWGTSYLIRNLVLHGEGLTGVAFHVVVAVVYGLLILAAGSLFHVAVRYPAPLLQPMKALVLPGLLFGFLLVGSIVQAIGPDPLVGQPRWFPSTYGWVLVVLGSVFFAAMLTMAFLCAVRFRAAGPQESEPAHFALMGAALLMDPGIRTGIWIVDRAPQAGFLLLALVVVAGAWLWNMWYASGPGARAARHVAWLALGLPVAGALAMVMTGDSGVVQNSGLMGLSRMITMLLLAYAILRHQLLGIDVRIRWGVSKSVLAGVFVAMFFMVSELSAWFFENRIGDVNGVDPTVIGIAAAGMLLFAISPLHQIADRIAARAVPVSSPGEGEGRAAYREAVVLALSDGKIDRRDERSLAKLAKVLGLDPEAALEVREHVEGRSLPEDRDPSRIGIG